MARPFFEQPSSAASAWRFFFVLSVVALTVTGARYYQAHANRALRSQTPQLLKDGSELATPYLDGVPRQGVSVLSLDPATVTERGEAESLLPLYHALHLYQQEGRFLHFLAEKSPEPWAVDVVARHLQTIVMSALHADLGRGHYETARFHAQRFINVLHALPFSEYFERFNDDLNFARKVVHLTTGHYLGVDRLVSDVVGSLRGADKPIPAARMEGADGWLREYAEYVNAAIVAARQRRQLDARAVWERFIAQQPQHPRRAEAIFNMINATMDAYKDVGEKDPERHSRITALSREALAMCREFVKSFPASYLADDALRYSLRLAFSLGEQDEVFAAYSRLARSYPKSDGFKRVQHGLATWVVDTDKASPEEARRLVDWLAEYVRHPGHAGPSVLSSQAAVGEPARVARLIGEGQVETFLRRDAKENVTQVLMKWLKERQAEEGVRALWEASSR